LVNVSAKLHGMSAKPTDVLTLETVAIVPE